MKSSDEFLNNLLSQPFPSKPIFPPYLDTIIVHNQQYLPNLKDENVRTFLQSEPVQIQESKEIPFFLHQSNEQKLHKTEERELESSHRLSLNPLIVPRKMNKEDSFHSNISTPKRQMMNKLSKDVSKRNHIMNESRVADEEAKEILLKIKEESSKMSTLLNCRLR